MGNGKGACTSNGGLPDKLAVHATSGFHRQEARKSHEKRPRDEVVEGESGDPGSGGKKSRVNSYGKISVGVGGDCDSTSSTGSLNSPRASVLEDEEVEDGEIPMAALGAVNV